MRAVFIPLAIFVLLNKIGDMFLYVIEMAVLLYSLHYICYIRVAVFFEVMVSLNTVPHLFSKYIKFFFEYWKLFLRVFQDTYDYIEFLGI